MVNSLRNYNSSDFPDLGNTIKHAFSNKLDISNTSFHYKFNDTVFVHYNVFEDYLDQIKALCVEDEIPDELFYKPEYVSYYLYGTVDLWYLILLINDMGSFYDFNRKKIKIIPTNELNLINNIIEKNKLRIKGNNNSPQVLDDLTIKKV